MRRLLIVCAVAVLTASLFSLLAVAQKPSGPSLNRGNSSVAAEPQSQGQSATITTASGRAPVVLATGIAVRSLALDSQANLYVAEASAPNRIFTLTGLSDLSADPASNSFASARLALIAGNGTTGSLGDGGSALASQFDLKLDSLTMRSGIAIAPDGTMFIADTLNSTIRRIAGSDSSEPGIVRSIAGRWGPRQEVTLIEPLGIALDRAGNLYVADRAAGTVDLLPFATDSSTTTQPSILAHVASPASIALTTDGAKAFIASPDTGAIFEIDAQSRAIHSVPGFAVQTDSSQKSPCLEQSSNASEKLAVCPAGVAVDGAGNLFVTDVNSGDILRLDARSHQLTIAASGLKSPGDINIDSKGNLYVAEQSANRLLKFAAMGDPAGNLTIGLPNPLPAPPAPRVCPPGPAGSYNFCDQPTGGATATQAFTVTATNAVTGLNISFSGTNPGDFQAASNNCGTSLAAGTSCSINIDFGPSATGSRSAVLSVSDSAGDTATAAVFGTGDDYQVTLNGTAQELSVFQGGTVTFKFNITPDTVFGGSVAIVCPVSSQLPSLTTCTPSPATVTVTPGTPAPFTITFDTTYNGVTAGSGSSSSNGSLPLTVPGNKRTPFGSSPLPVWFFPAALVVAVVCIAFLLRASRRSSRNRNLAWVSLAFAMMCGISVFVACKHSSIQPGLNTPVGTKNLTIQGTAQNAGRGNTIILDVVAH